MIEDTGGRGAETMCRPHLEEESVVKATILEDNTTAKEATVICAIATEQGVGPCT